MSRTNFDNVCIYIQSSCVIDIQGDALLINHLTIWLDFHIATYIIYIRTPVATQ